jgi:thiol-disulfide isomerase/thioredoxin
MAFHHSRQPVLSVLEQASVWLNAAPFTAERLHGSPVLIDFWTYSCVNWLRTLPYVRAWHETYQGDGLVVIGAHAPEFGFEHDLDNVTRAVGELGVQYPVVIDNDFSIWRAFENDYWPAVYLVDAEGGVGYHHFGEQAYGETERAIQRLLGRPGDLVHVKADGLALAADWDTLQSPETYVGTGRGERRVSRPSERLALNEWALEGQWNVGAEAGVLAAAPGSISYCFEARDVNLVMGAPESGARFTITLDGEPPGEDHGLDVDASGAGTLTEPRMYQLVRQRHAVRRRTLQLTFLDAGVSAYVFTFG